MSKTVQDSAIPARRRFAALLLALAAGGAAAPAVAAGVPGQGTWETTLLPRDIDGDGVVDAWYDTDLHITWLAHSRASGKQTWPYAMAWAERLVVKGVGGWHLPSFGDPSAECDYSETGGTNCGYKPDPSTSDMAHLWYVTLGNIGAPDPGWGLSNTGPFDQLTPYVYWTRDKYIIPGGEAWSFQTKEGRQQRHHTKFKFYGWAVHDGDVPFVPLPGQLR